MKIAIVAPSAVPFTVGGAENLWFGLQNYINAETLHDAELIKLPAPERDFWELMRSYREFSRLDLNHFDLIISTKYPAWMVSHPRHVCYLQHKLRGLYDTYHFCGLPKVPSNLPRELTELCTHMEAYAGRRDGLDEFFARLFELKGNRECESALMFPGPMSRQIVHHLDGIGLSPDAVSKFAAISKNVAKRADYFPPGADVAVVHHPPALTGFRGGRFDYFFTASRLDPPKRVDILIEAMKRTSVDVPLKIAGEGPELDRLRALAQDDQRIEFLGFVRKRELLNYYADALAVPFVPYDEDMGLITIEAMLSGKPVLTGTDAGGPLEFVQDGVTGLVTKSTPEAFGQSMTKLAADRGWARKMGSRGRTVAVQISWKDVVNVLIAKPGNVDSGFRNCVRGNPRRRLVLATTYPVYPPKGGGPVRIFNLYRHLARAMDITLVTMAQAGNSWCDREIAPNLREVQVPMSARHAEAEMELSRDVDWIPVTDVAMPLLYKYSPSFVETLSAEAASADVLVASHPYLLPALPVSRQELWYEAHNVELILKREMLPDNSTSRRLLDATKAVELQCWSSADYILACSASDVAEMERLYGPSAASIKLVPNGVDVEASLTLSDAERDSLRRRLGFDGRLVAIFMGSWHGPNISALNHILLAAQNKPDIDFVVLGSVSSAVEEREIPDNIALLGFVDDEAKKVLLAAADLALNPMESGSGSNLKMLDYLAAGLPVISTRFGIRGLELPSEALILAEANHLADALTDCKNDISRYREAARSAREAIRRVHGWDVIADRLLTEIDLETQPTRRLD